MSKINVRSPYFINDNQQAVLVSATLKLRIYAGKFKYKYFRDSNTNSHLPQ